ncbi:hypothetical protein EBU71_21005, partial [bacterium]|nr:hypothetical protein [Candidatus Elulimicrobium humile]
IKEVIQSEFVDAYPIEAYIENYEGYADNTTLLSKFGIQSTQEINLVISKERFEEYISPLIKNKPNIKLSTRPKEGDLIYFPLGDRLFEIKFVEHEKPFYQLQKNYIYLLKCELFRYEDEILDTSIDEIDDILTGGESDGLSDDNINVILGITVTNRGGGYITTPTVGISSSPIGGKTGIATAIMIGGIVACTDNVNPKAQSVQSVEITNPGSGYTVAPGIRFIGGGGAGAAATATIGDGVIGIITVTNGGSGYSTSPTISFTNQIFKVGVSTAPATATAVVSAAGTIAAIRITNAGLGYSVAPTIVISNPSLASTGNFVFNEVVVGSSSSTTAKVRTWNSITNILEVSNVSGSFIIGENIIGSTSGASHQLRLIDLNVNNDGFSDNSEIESEADLLIDFSESNPFGVP